jgi:hypothetical protein
VTLFPKSQPQPVAAEEIQGVRDRVLRECAEAQAVAERLLVPVCPQLDGPGLVRIGAVVLD